MNCGILAWVVVQDRGASTTVCRDTCSTGRAVCHYVTVSTACAQWLASCTLHTACKTCHGSSGIAWSIDLSCRRILLTLHPPVCCIFQAQARSQYRLRANHLGRGPLQPWFETSYDHVINKKAEVDDVMLTLNVDALCVTGCSRKPTYCWAQDHATSRYGAI